MEKEMTIYNEMRAAAERVFNEGICAPAVSSDSIQAAESTDNADTLDVAPAVSSDSIQTAESTDNADTLDVAPAQNPYIIGPAKN